MGVSPYGAYDMAGNLREWVADWFGEYPSGSVLNPLGPDTGEMRVLRGGSWNSYAGGIRTATRDGDGPTRENYGNEGYGFRCALPPQ